jgi:hypothetical protein
LVAQALIFAVEALSVILGIAITANALRISTTISSSINVKPFLNFIIISFPKLKINKPVLPLKYNNTSA